MKRWSCKPILIFVYTVCERCMEESFSSMQVLKQKEKLEMSHLNKCTCSFSTLSLIIVFHLNTCTFRTH